jgi:hypothetical protein
MQRNILFGNSRSFIRPTLFIAGHTDSTGGSSLNKKLSERRARSVQAVLQSDTNQWEILYGAKPDGEEWGMPELTDMVIETGEANPNDPVAINNAVAKYKAPGKKAEREGLFRRYFECLLGVSAIPPIKTTAPSIFGYGEGHLLRGNRNNPSKNQNLPPIKGDFEKNRRVEFFFTVSSTIVTKNYAQWTSPCSVIRQPVPIISVVWIAPVEVIRKNQTTDIPVLILLSLPPNQSITLTLSTTTGTGEASFDRTNSTQMTITATEIVTVRGVTESSVTDNIRLSATITNQTQILAFEDFTVTDTVSIFLRFEVWDLINNRFEPLPAGVDVDIMDYELHEQLLTKQTDTSGRVLFNVPRLLNSNGKEPDMFFLVHTNGMNHAHHTTLPDEWSTKGWKADDGSPGYYENYIGSPLGTPSHPLIFRIGLDFHARFLYEDIRTNRRQVVPDGIPVHVYSGDSLKCTHPTYNGEVYDVIFDIEPGEDFIFVLLYEMTDPSINLKKTVIRFSIGPEVLHWSTFWNDQYKQEYSNYDRTSIYNRTSGIHNDPQEFICATPDWNAFFFILKILREWSIFLFLLTGGEEEWEWKGVEELTIYPTSISGRSYSWPRGSVNIDEDDLWKREIIVHELSHQIMWKELDITDWDVVNEALPGGVYFLNHWSNLLSNRMHALMEGWANFMEAIFDDSTQDLPYFVTIVEDRFENRYALGHPHPLPANPLPPPTFPSILPPISPIISLPTLPVSGESVEGAFANSLWNIFRRNVVAPCIGGIPNVTPGNPLVPESDNGNIRNTAANVWLNNDEARERFLSVIWKPFKSLKNVIVMPSTAHMIAAIKSNNQSEWHKILPELLAFNMAMNYTPTINMVSPNWGSTAGSQSVTITGTNFIDDTTVDTYDPQYNPHIISLSTNVTFDGVPAVSVTVNKSTELEAIPPNHPPDTVDIVVTTAAGSFRRLNAYTYINDPLMILDVNPRDVSTSGGDIITISGQGFIPGAIVYIDGLIVNNLFVQIHSPGIITVETPPRSSPGPVSVAIQNPDGSFYPWSGQLQYIASP